MVIKSAWQLRDQFKLPMKNYFSIIIFLYLNIKVDSWFVYTETQTFTKMSKKTIRAVLANATAKMLKCQNAKMMDGQTKRPPVPNQ